MHVPGDSGARGRGLSRAGGAERTAPPECTIDALLRGEWIDPDDGAAIGVPIDAIVIERSLAGEEAGRVAALRLGRRLAVVSDAVTHDVLGARIERALRTITHVDSIVLPAHPHADMRMSLRHYRFEVQNGIAPLWTSVVVSLLAAVIGVAVTVAAASATRWLRPVLAQVLYFLSVLPAAVPGMVLGLGYIFAFNAPGNPLEWLYGGLLILALCNVYHYHAQGYLVAATASGQVSRVFDETSTCLGATAMRTLRAVILPLIAPAIASIAVFFFVRSMVTLSAVIFIVTPSTQLAAVSVLLLDDSGNQNQAAAFSVCIM